jgi:catechol 2,3-dioxygenase-like lactoylglutathione lyase family enzyme
LTSKPAFTGVLQVGLVVRDLDRAVRTYYDEYGIGPWRILKINPDLAQDLTIDERPAGYSMRVALAMIGDVQWELIQPLDDKTPYADFLRTHGEGLHHVALAVDDFKQAGQALRAQGHHCSLGGRYRGAEWAYFATENKLAFTAEIFDLTNLVEGEPESVYPPLNETAEGTL